MAAIVGWGLQELQPVRIFARVEPGNEASARMLRRLAFVREGTLRRDDFARGRHFDTDLFARLAD